MKWFNYIVLVAATLTLSGLMACGDSSSNQKGPGFSTPDGDNTTNFNEIQLIRDLTNNVITPRFESFNSKSNQLQSAIDNYCQTEKSFNAGNNTQQERDGQKTNAQTEWQQTMAEWQIIEVMQLGPLLENQGLLKNQIYSWPILTSTCGVDQDVVFFNQGEINGSPYDINNRVVTRRGLGALEYLLFNDNLQHTCTSVPPENWDSFSDAEKRELRCDFALEVAKDVNTSAQNLLDNWSGNNGYAQSLLNADTSPGSDFSSTHQAVNRISDGLFYIDSVSKDSKLGIPLGLFANSCQQNICAENLESLFAFNSLANIRNNLLGLQALFTGENQNQTNSLGFDDYLINEGAATAANEIAQAIDQALADIDNYQQNLHTVLQTNASQVETTHAKIKDVTDKLKQEFITRLSLQLPASSAGDND